MKFPLDDVLASLFFAGFLAGARYLLIRGINRNSDVVNEEQRRWIRRTNVAIVVIVTMGLVLIWAPQLRSMVMSLAAVSVAIVVATKEMILCLCGALMRILAQPFKIGDRIVIDGIAGEVTDINAFFFRMQEIEMSGGLCRFTGKSAEIPNARLFTNIIENINVTRDYVFIDIPLTLRAGLDAGVAFRALTAIVERHYAPLRSEARAISQTVERKTGMDIADPEPDISAGVTDSGLPLYTVRLLCPVNRVAELRRAIVQDFLNIAGEEA